MKDLKIIVPNNFKEFGNKVNEHINRIRETNQNYLVKTNLVRFNNGEGKAVLEETIRDKDLYILSDISNYDISYEFFNRKHYMSPDEHFQDIKRILSAECGHASKITLILPYLYESRQDKKDSRESLDCAVALQEISRMGVNEIITCDVHNKGVMNAVPNLAFESVYLTGDLILSILENEKDLNINNIASIAPDSGAMDRARFVSNVLGNGALGYFYKQRDYTKLENGLHPIVDHRFLGPNLSGLDAIVVDDMIASGSSILDTAKNLKEQGVSKVYLMTTFALFTSGIDKFDKYYEKGYFDRVYATNVSYVREEVKNREWFNSVDCSYKIANIINHLNYGNSIDNLINDKEETAVKVKRLRKD